MFKFFILVGILSGSTQAFSQEAFDCLRPEGFQEYAKLTQLKISMFLESLNEDKCKKMNEESGGVSPLDLFFSRAFDDLKFEGFDNEKDRLRTRGCSRNVPRWVDRDPEFTKYVRTLGTMRSADEIFTYLMSENSFFKKNAENLRASDLSCAMGIGGARSGPRAIAIVKDGKLYHLAFGSKFYCQVAQINDPSAGECGVEKSGAGYPWIKN